MPGSSLRKYNVRRMKLSDRIVAQMENGAKLTLTLSCPPYCRGIDNHICLYEEGIEKLRQEWNVIKEAMEKNQHFNMILETNIFVEAGVINYVTATVIDGRKLMIAHSRNILLPDEENNPSAPSEQHCSNRISTDKLVLNLKGFGKLGQFLHKYAEKEDRNSEAAAEEKKKEEEKTTTRSDSLSDQMIPVEEEQEKEEGAETE
jgi:hypothetical protein